MFLSIANSSKHMVLCDVLGCKSLWTCDRPGKPGFRHCVCAEHAGIDREDFLCRLFNGRIMARSRMETRTTEGGPADDNHEPAEIFAEPFFTKED